MFRYLVGMLTGSIKDGSPSTGVTVRTRELAVKQGVPTLWDVRPFREADMSRLVCGVAVLCVVLLVGCAGRSDLGPMLGRGREQAVQLTVQNNRFEDAAIYAMWRGGPRRRVGLATGTTSSTFSFEWVSDVVQFEVDFIAADGYTVDPIEVSPGDHLDLVILGVK